MEKSIETIWKEGFLNNDALIAPKLNNLYNQKSIHIVDKFIRMLKINLNAVIIGSFVILAITFFMEIPIMGIGFFLVLNTIVIVNKRLLNSLQEINKNESSYQYVKSFHTWMKVQISVNQKMAKFYYPIFFLSIVAGFWFSPQTQPLHDDILLNPEGYYPVFGIPLIGAIPVLLGTILLWFTGDRIYNWDLSIVYGRVIRKLEEIITDMEELRT